MPTFEEVRYKPLEALTDDDKKVIQEHYAELDDDDKAAFSEFLVDPNAGGEGGEGSDDGSAGAGEGEGDAGKADEKNNQVPPQFQFKSKEEFDAYLEKRDKERAEAGKKADEEEKNKGKAVEFFPKDWKPSDWNEFAREFYKKAFPQMLNDIRDLSTREREELKAIDKEFDAQYNALAEAGKVPALNTKEGQDINRQISLFGAKHGKGSITEAYELWSVVPVEHGGGLKVAGSADAGKSKEETEKERLEEQKRKASMVGGGKSGGDGAKNTKQRPYQDIHGKSMDQLLAEHT